MAVLQLFLWKSIKQQNKLKIIQILYMMMYNVS